MVVTTSSSAPVASCDCRSRDATIAGEPTNRVSTRIEPSLVDGRGIGTLPPGRPSPGQDGLTVADRFDPVDDVTVKGAGPEVLDGAGWR
jgi:hypothetical protein